MSELRLTDEQEHLLKSAAQDLAATEDTHGMTTSVVIAYTIMREDGEEVIGGYYSGGYIQALGLLEDAKARIMYSDEE